MIETTTRILDWIGAGLLVFVFLVFIYGIIFIHDIPYEIAKKRSHPHQDAIHAAGWLSLFLLHVIWPLLWIWALLYKPGTSTKTNDVLEHGLVSHAEEKDEIAQLRMRITELEREIASSKEAPPAEE